MMCPPQSVNTYGTPSRRSAWATIRPPCIDGVGSLRGARQKIKERRLLARLDGGVDRDVARGETLLHLDHFLLLHVEPLGDELGDGREALALQALALLLQVEEELALRLRGA